MTVEASLVMILTLGVLAAILYCGFYYHDRVVLSGNAYEAAVWGAHHEKLGDTSAAELTTEMQLNRNRGKLWFYREITYRSSGAGDTVRATAQGERRVSGIPLMERVLPGLSWSGGADMKCPAIVTEKLIRRSRILKEKT